MPIRQYRYKDCNTHTKNDQKKRLSPDNLFLLKIGVYEWWLYATFGALVSMSSIFVTAKTVL